MSEDAKIVLELPNDPSGYGAVVILSDGVQLAIEFEYNALGKPRIGRIEFLGVKEFSVYSFRENAEKAPEKSGAVYCEEEILSYNYYRLWIYEDIILHIKSQSVSMKHIRNGRMPADFEDWKIVGSEN